jgi:hypothetical protein
MTFNRSLVTSVFPDAWKLSFMTPIFKCGRQNDEKNYQKIAVLLAISKLFELLVYKDMYVDLKNLISTKLYNFVEGLSAVSNLVEYSSFVLNTIEDGCQVDSGYTDFTKAFDRIRYCLLPNKMSTNIEPARCLWLRSYFFGRMQRIRTGDCGLKDILVTSGVRLGSHLGLLCFIFGL